MYFTYNQKILSVEYTHPRIYLELCLFKNNIIIVISAWQHLFQSSLKSDRHYMLRIIKERAVALL